MNASTKTLCTDVCRAHIAGITRSDSPPGDPLVNLKSKFPLHSPRGNSLRILMDTPVTVSLFSNSFPSALFSLSFRATQPSSILRT